MPVTTTSLLAGIGTVVVLIKTDDGTPERPRIRLVVRIEANGIETYDATATADVPEPLVRLLRPGAQVAVRVDPDERDTPIIDLSRVWITPAVAAS